MEINMEKIKGLPKSLPPKELPFSISLKGSFNTNHTYVGDFVVRVGGTREMSRMGLELAKLNRGVKFEDLDLGTAILHNSIAFLKAYLVEAPEWFTSPSGMDYGLDTMDTNIPLEIFAEAEKQILQWKESVRGEVGDLEGKS
jgi:hypothetical protein